MAASPFAVSRIVWGRRSCGSFCRNSCCDLRGGEQIGSFSNSLTLCLFGNIHDGNLRDEATATDECGWGKGLEGRSNGAEGGKTVLKSRFDLNEVFVGVILEAVVTALLSKASVRDLRALYS